MSDIIRLLPDSVANQIAAGEVIQRPASVIKELVENSIDAGATSITIILKDAGRTLIQVIDNGCGMSDTDARMAFERHATSKIARADDLFTLHTMGFRGEALASIAAIAQVDLRTMLHGASLGTRLLINGSKVESQEPEACVPGSNLMVKNLFFNVPARRKFLKKDTVEMSAIMREFERLALVNTAVDFTLVSNDATLHSLRRGSMKQRICELFGKNLDKQLIPIETETSIVSINGFIGLPANARKRNPLQYFMVNGRNMRHPYFHKAVMQCYEKLIPADEQPNYFINLHVDPETIDVNIHPTKNEIKFENEQAIWQILTAAIRDSLGRFNAGPAIDFDVEDAPDIPVFSPDAQASHEVQIDERYNPFAESSPLPADWTGRPSSVSTHERPSFRSRPASLDDWEKLYDDFMRKRDEGFTAMAGSSLNIGTPVPSALTAPEADTLSGLQTDLSSGGAVQLQGSYIVTPVRDGLMVIDQYRAHVRILYDDYLTRTSEHAFVAQTTMFPDVIELSPAQHAVLLDISPSLSEWGFILTHREGTSWSIDGIPSVVRDASARDLLTGLIEMVTETGNDMADTLREKVALSLAKSSAIRRGRILSADEMDRIVSDLLRLPSHTLTPEGKKVFTVIPVDQISRLLG